jgi:hypothetical protein
MIHPGTTVVFVTAAWQCQSSSRIAIIVFSCVTYVDSATAALYLMLDHAYETGFVVLLSRHVMPGPSVC